MSTRKVGIYLKVLKASKPRRPYSALKIEEVGYTYVPPKLWYLNTRSQGVTVRKTNTVVSRTTLFHVVDYFVIYS
jgi:hypothetical protein